MRLALCAALREEIASAATAAFPSECCGLIEGVEKGGNFHALALHPARNLAAGDRFAIDPADHFAAVKGARDRGHRIIGCYHSHPNGEAQPSPRDLAGAGEENFLWLIAATDGVQSLLRGFVYSLPGFAGIVLSEAVGADLVTSSLNERK